MHDAVSFRVPYSRGLDSIGAWARGAYASVPERARWFVREALWPQLPPRDRDARQEVLASLSRPGDIDRLAKHMEEAWHIRIQGWGERRRVVVFDEAAQVLCKAVCTWCGIPMSTHERLDLVRYCLQMIEGRGSIGPRRWRAARARARATQWATHVVERIRTGQVQLPEGSPARIIAMYHASGTQLWSVQQAASALIDVIGATVALSWPVTFAALALHEQPGCAGRLRSDEEFEAAFLDETLQSYPSTTLVRDRHHQWALPFGGDLLVMHALRVALRTLVRRVSYGVPKQDCRYATRRIPTRPKSGLIIQNVQLVERDD